MEKKLLTFFFTLLLISSLLLASTQAKNSIMRQTDALEKFYKLNYFSKYSDESSPFEANEEDDISDHMLKIIKQKGSRKEDKIERLPGQPTVEFDQYGGYVTVDEKAGRAFYYYFAEAEKAKHSKPLVLWLNGGPGCSSIGYGAMQELGPFRVYSDGKTLFKNPYAWNNAANLLFLESPAGVGFSYSNTTSDYKSGGDKQTAQDNYVFLLNWLERFPKYKSRDFYITGESYGGHYVPQLAHNIIQGDIKANKTLINLKGIMIGNAVINDDTDVEGRYDYLYSHNILNDEMISDIKKNCNFSAPSKECAQSTFVANFFVLLSNINMYNIYYPSCHNGNLTTKPEKETVMIDPCSVYYVNAYLNQPQVQKALHANLTKISHEWQHCSDDLFKNWNDKSRTTIPLLKEFMKNGIRVWIYNGDLDAVVPVTSTKYSLAKMNLSVEKEYCPWYLDEEAGGFREVYEGGLTFATVRGAGHEVPSYQPARALSLVEHFLDGTPLPSPCDDWINTLKSF